MDWKSITAAGAVIMGLLGLDTWIMKTMLDANTAEQAAAVDGINQRLGRIVDEYVRMTNEIAKVRAQQRVDHILRVCAERPYVCEEGN